MENPAASPFCPSRVRFGVLACVCTLSLLTYLDRVCISRVQENIRTDLSLDKVQMGWVFAAFAVGYALFEVPGGWMGDVWGTRRVITRIVLWWSLFTALTGSVWASAGSHRPLLVVLGVPVTGSLLLLLLVRFLFGCGEAGAYPNLARVVGSWFPFRERAAAQGTIWMSARLGGAVAPLVIGRLTEAFGWRQAFWVLGLIGAAWAVVFYTWFRNTPEEKAGCNDAERALIRHGPHSWDPEQAAAGHARPPWGRLLLSRNIWALCVASFGVSFGWYFYPTWQPQYLKDVHGIAFADSELLSGLPFFCGAAGALLGGRLSDALVRRTGSRRWGRSLIGLIGFGGAGLCVLLTGWAQNATQAVTLLCLAFFINDLAIPPIWAVSADIGGRYTGTVSGFMNMVGALAAVLNPALTGSWQGHYSWPVIFQILATAWFVAAGAWLFINAEEPLVPEDTKDP